MASERYQAYEARRATKLAEVAVIVGSPSVPRLKWLREASSNLGALAPRLVSVYADTLPREIEWLQRHGQLAPELAERLIRGFRAAATACKAAGTSFLNSAGLTPRRALIEARVSLPDIMLLLSKLADHPVDDPQSNAYYTSYGMLHDAPRKEPFVPFPADCLALKFGDTYKHARFGVARVPLQSPAAWRYGASVGASSAGREL